MRRFFAVTFSALALAGAGSAQELKAKVPTVDPGELNRLADQLADRDYRVRESAGKKLGTGGRCACRCAATLPPLARH